MLALAFMLLEAGQGLLPGGFIPLPRRPSATDLECANYSKAEWLVTTIDEGLKVSAHGSRDQTQDPLPFAYGRHQDRKENAMSFT